MPCNRPLHPVILLPGVCGSMIKAFSCEGGASTAETGWLNDTLTPYPQLSTKFMSCLTGRFIDDASLHYRSYCELASGGSIAVRPEKGSAGCTKLLSHRALELPYIKGKRLGTYFALIMEHLVENYGYTLDKDLFGYSYDWRQPLHTPLVMDPLRDLITSARQASGRKVIIVAHSMGCLVTTTFMRLFPDWSTLICGFVALGGPFCGSGASGLGSILTGYNLNEPINPCVCRTVQASGGSTPYLNYAHGRRTLVAPSIIVKLRGYDNLVGCGMSGGTILMKYTRSDDEVSLRKENSWVTNLPEELYRESLRPLKLNRSLYNFRTAVGEQAPNIAALLLCYLESHPSVVSAEQFYVVALLAKCCVPDYVQEPKVFSNPQSFNVVYKDARKASNAFFDGLPEYVLQKREHPLDLYGKVTIVFTPEFLHSLCGFPAVPSTHSLPESLMHDSSDSSALKRVPSVAKPLPDECEHSSASRRNNINTLKEIAANLIGENFDGGNVGARLSLESKDSVGEPEIGQTLLSVETSHDFAYLQQENRFGDLVAFSELTLLEASEKKEKIEALLAEVLKNNPDECSQDSCSLSSAVSAVMAIARADSPNGEYALSERKCKRMREAVDIATLADEAAELRRLTRRAVRMQSIDESIGGDGMVDTIQQKSRATEESTDNAQLGVYESMKQSLSTLSLPSIVDSNIIGQTARQYKNMLLYVNDLLRLRAELTSTLTNEENIFRKRHASYDAQLSEGASIDGTDYFMKLPSRSAVSSEDLESSAPDSNRSVSSSIKQNVIDLLSSLSSYHASVPFVSSFVRSLLHDNSKSVEPSESSALAVRNFSSAMCTSFSTIVQQAVPHRHELVDLLPHLTVPNTLDRMLYGANIKAWNSASSMLAKEIPFDEEAKRDFRFLNVTGTGFLVGIHLYYGDAVDKIDELPYNSVKRLNSYGDGTVPLHSALSDPFPCDVTLDRIILSKCLHFGMMRDPRIHNLIGHFVSKSANGWDNE